LLYEGSTIHNVSDQFVSCVYFFFVGFHFHPKKKKKMGSVRANFKQLYLHTRPARPRTQHDYHHDTNVKPEAATAVIELLMMNGKTPGTR
jgi:hypothetical protein